MDGLYLFTNLSSTPVVNCGFTARMPMPTFVTTKTYVFLTYTQSMFASFGLDSVLVSHFLKQRRLMALVGHRVSSIRSSIVQDGDEGVAGRNGKG